jgi:hypothetical protein
MEDQSRHGSGGPARLQPPGDTDHAYMGWPPVTASTSPVT